MAVGWLNTPLLDYIPKETQATITRDCMVNPNTFGDPDQFAHLAQSIVINPHINATTIELSAGLNMALWMNVLPVKQAFNPAYVFE